ncbi:MAG: DUF547 domain-containing protein [Flavobacteriaceae bacterium]|nr:DUF547 domain-containing protein [Flavobacteriaceae bacterium]
MKSALFFGFILIFNTVNCQNTVDYQQLSENLLNQLKNKNSYEKQVNLLEKSTLKELRHQLKTDKEKIAFWVNIYNAFIQIKLQENPKLYNDRGKFFSDERIQIAGEMLSFDDIEHGILRKSKIKISLGYLRKWFRPKWERKLRVKKVDWRIHFALNCGAKSCPPVAIYKPGNLDEQLDFMSKAYLNEQTSFNAETKTATTSVLISWFRGDFCGFSGAKKILFSYKITKEKPKKLDFRDYNWTLLLGNYRELPQF